MVESFTNTGTLNKEEHKSKNNNNQRENIERGHFPEGGSLRQRFPIAKKGGLDPFPGVSRGGSREEGKEFDAKRKKGKGFSAVQLPLKKLSRKVPNLSRNSTGKKSWGMKKSFRLTKRR